jgi:O-antigen/teichoic acid export membrane protein
MVDTENQDATDGSGLSSLPEIVEGAGLYVVGRGSSNVLGLLTNFILTRILGAALYGIYAYINVVFGIVLVFTKLGGDKAVLRYLPEYSDNPKMQNTMLTTAYTISLGASLLVAAMVYLGAPVISSYTLDEPLFVDVLRITAILIPFRTLSNITYAAFKSLSLMEYNVGVSSIARPIMKLVFVGGAVLLGLSIYGAAAGLVVTGILVFLLGIALLFKKSRLGEFNKPTFEQTKEYTNFSAPLTFQQLGNFLYNKVDIIMVGLFLTGSAVGIYNIAVILARVLAIPLKGFNQMFPPIASSLYHDGESQELDSVYSTVTRWIFTVALYPALVAILYSPEILAIFGPDFVRGRYVLTLFAIAQLMNCAVGPSGFLLMMTDNQYVTLMNQLLSGLLNVVLNFVLILEFGFIGAAAATASVLAGVNVLRVIEIWYLEGLFPYDLTYYKPVGAGVLSAGLLYLLGFWLDGYYLLVGGGILGGVMFAAMILVFGIEQEDKEMFRSFVS